MKISNYFYWLVYRLFPINFNTFTDILTEHFFLLFFLFELTKLIERERGKNEKSKGLSRLNYLSFYYLDEQSDLILVVIVLLLRLYRFYNDTDSTIIVTLFSLYFKKKDEKEVVFD